MGHRIISQNRGRGGPTYRAPSHRYKAELKHACRNNEGVNGKIIDIEHDPARHAPIARVEIADGKKIYMLVTEGMGVGDEVAWGAGAKVQNGNTLPLRDIPIGAYVCNIESKPNDGGKFVRSSGVQAMLVGKNAGRVAISMPSGKQKWFNDMCMATIGIVAGGGRGEKPFVKAGNKYHKMKSQAQKWPRSSGLKMNVIDHPFGGGGHQHTGRPKTVARGTSPGRKVGSIAARRTGKLKK
ncbi:50S ribosomal protein L2 [Methanofollis fontis]|uniref:Large ribosomal subunit protein uL2 n=1 Tax=Methanofollis fontis TaxID=2052832 RepID=A0A483CTU4_9EURY|nr:50S ribosomal protein L2 [Methanofollis fontis]TAJ45834.1 50S ribosomal protein L2 [Methanofollis fontis]